MRNPLERGQGITRFGNYWAPEMGELPWSTRVGSTVVHLRCAALRILCSSEQVVSGPTNYGYCKALFAPNSMLPLDLDEALEPLGHGLQKAQRQQAWFSEPPIKELGSQIDLRLKPSKHLLHVNIYCARAGQDNFMQ